ncbi:unnamed protein product [Urochloa humidicola]
MEPSAAWGPCESQLANCTVEEPADGEVWAPAAGGRLPVENSFINIYPDIWSLQPYLCCSSSGGQQQLVEYNYYAAATQQQYGLIFEKAAAAAQESLEVDMLHDMKMEIYKNNPIQLFKEADRKLEDDIGMVNAKIHRYPPSIQDIGDWYTLPRIVAIGPYYHWRQELRHTENVKHVAAYRCIKTSGHSVQDMYDAVVSAVEQIHARRLYSKDVMEGIGDDNFLPLMFFDACFLVMYMRQISCMPCDAKLYNFFESNAKDIAHDITLLENQIPWPVVEAVMKYTPVPLEEFIPKWRDGCLQDRVDEVPSVGLHDSYRPPHLLGLLRFHIVGRSRKKTKAEDLDKMKSIAISVSAIELSEMGINLKANKTTELGNMDLTMKPIFLGELSMPPLSLNDLRASLLVNMAALELCTTPDFFDNDNKAKDEDSAVCSYLLLLCMLVHRKEDVHQLRTKGILQGGGGLSNTNALKFFTRLQSLRFGRCCGHVMVQIESYRIKRQMRIKMYAFIRNNWKTIIGVFSAIGVFGSILSAIKSLKGAH